MADKHSPEARRRNMAAVKGKNTKPEMRVRRALHGRGFRYGLHNKALPGKPDLVLPKYNAVIFVHGCFWHAHDCPAFSWPKTREAFWREKIGGNQVRDAANIEALLASGRRVAVIWECALKGKHKPGFEDVIDTLSDWLQHGDKQPHLSLAGRPPAD